MDTKKLYVLIAVSVLVIALTASLGYYYGAKKAKKDLFKVGETPKSDVINSNIFVYNVLNNNSTQYAKTEVNYPQVKGASVEFNKSIADFVNAAVDGHNKNSEENWKARVETAMPGDNISAVPNDNEKFTISGGWKLAQLNDNYVSLLVTYYDFSGGAHGQSIVKSFNYDFKNNKIMTLQDLYPNDPEYLQKVSKSVIDTLTERYVKPGYTSKEQVDDGAGPVASNFEAFTFENSNLISIYFQDYQVGPHAMGMPVVDVYPAMN